MAKPKHKLRVPRPRKGAVELLIGTRKGAFRLKSDRERGQWKLSAPIFLGHIEFGALALEVVQLVGEIHGVSGEKCIEKSRWGADIVSAPGQLSVALVAAIAAASASATVV